MRRLRNDSSLSRLLAWLPAIAVMTAIFLFSAQPAELSAETSDAVTRLLLAIGQRLRLFEVPDADIYLWCERLAFPVRKAAHMTEYLILYVTLLLGFFCWGVRGKKWCLYSLAGTVLYACTDEFHQLFVPGRSGMLTDVLIDSAGAAILTLFLLARCAREADAADSFPDYKG